MRKFLWGAWERKSQKCIFQAGCVPFPDWVSMGWGVQGGTRVLIPWPIPGPKVGGGSIRNQPQNLECVKVCWGTCKARTTDSQVHLCVRHLPPAPSPSFVSMGVAAKASWNSQPQRYFVFSPVFIEPQGCASTLAPWGSWEKCPNVSSQMGKCPQNRTQMPSIWLLTEAVIFFCCPTWFSAAGLGTHSWESLLTSPGFQVVPGKGGATLLNSGIRGSCSDQIHPHRMSRVLSVIAVQGQLPVLQEDSFRSLGAVSSLPVWEAWEAKPIPMGPVGTGPWNHTNAQHLGKPMLEEAWSLTLSRELYHLQQHFVHSTAFRHCLFLLRIGATSQAVGGQPSPWALFLIHFPSAVSSHGHPW